MAFINYQNDPQLADLARWFHLEDPADDVSHVPQPFIQIEPGSICLITGASGSGKTSLLCDLTQSMDQNSLVFFDSICIPNRPCAKCFDDASIDESLTLLSSVGLAEAATFLKCPDQLSEGQRWRLKLACALHCAKRSKKNTWIIADEFAALLDRVTASIVARALRLVVDRSNQDAGKLGAILATSHDDLRSALDPDMSIVCDFGARMVQRKRNSNQRMNR